MPTAISVQGAVRLAKDALGDVPPQQLADWIAIHLSLTVKPVIVTVMLGSFLEKEHIERMRLAALELIEKASVEPPAAKPQGRRKAKAADEVAGRNDCPPSDPGLQCPSVPGEEQQLQPLTSTQGCPGCGSTDYVFRGRKQIKADPVKGIDPAVETKHACRACGHHWKVKTAA